MVDTGSVRPGRVGGSFPEILFGFVLIVCSGTLPFWNEGGTVKTARSLNEASRDFVVLHAPSVDPANGTCCLRDRPRVTGKGVFGSIQHVIGGLVSGKRQTDKPIYRLHNAQSFRTLLPKAGHYQADCRCVRQEGFSRSEPALGPATLRVPWIPFPTPILRPP